MKTPLDEKDLLTGSYWKKVRESGKRYKKFDWPSVEVLLNLLYVYDKVWAHFSKRMAACDLSPAVFNVLMILSRGARQKLTQHDISKLLLVSRANMTEFLKGLERRGLAKRMADKSDRRVRLVKITKKGRVLLEAYLPRHYVEISGIFADFDAGEKKQLNTLIHKLRGGVD